VPGCLVGIIATIFQSTEFTHQLKRQKTVTCLKVLPKMKKRDKNQVLW